MRRWYRYAGGIVLKKSLCGLRRAASRCQDGIYTKATLFFKWPFAGIISELWPTGEWPTCERICAQKSGMGCVGETINLGRGQVECLQSAEWIFRIYCPQFLEIWANN